MPLSTLSEPHDPAFIDPDLLEPVPDRLRDNLIGAGMMSRELLRRADLLEFVWRVDENRLLDGKVTDTPIASEALWFPQPQFEYGPDSDLIVVSDLHPVYYLGLEGILLHMYYMDPPTYEHSLRVSLIASELVQHCLGNGTFTDAEKREILALLSGWDGAVRFFETFGDYDSAIVAMITIGGLIHDVGKVALWNRNEDPSHVSYCSMIPTLRLPRKLHLGERDVVRTHIGLGVEALRDCRAEFFSWAPGWHHFDPNESAEGGIFGLGSYHTDFPILDQNSLDAVLKFVGILTECDRGDAALIRHDWQQIATDGAAFLNQERIKGSYPVILAQMEIIYNTRGNPVLRADALLRNGGN